MSSSDFWSRKIGHIQMLSADWGVYYREWEISILELIKLWLQDQFNFDNVGHYDKLSWSEMTSIIDFRLLNVDFLIEFWHCMPTCHQKVTSATINITIIVLDEFSYKYNYYCDRWI